MIPPAFGFSAGDFVAAISLVRKASQALKTSGGAADEYQALSHELELLLIVLEQLRDLRPASSASQNHYNVVRGMAEEIQSPLRQFVEKIRTKFGSLGSQTSCMSWKSSKERIKWATSMQGEVGKMRAMVTMKMMTACVLLAIPTGYSIPFC